MRGRPLDYFGTSADLPLAGAAVGVCAAGAVGVVGAFGTVDGAVGTESAAAGFAAGAVFCGVAGNGMSRGAVGAGIESMTPPPPPAGRFADVPT